MHAACIPSRSDVSWTHWSYYPHVKILIHKYTLAIPRHSRKIARVLTFFLAPVSKWKKTEVVPDIAWMLSISSCPGWAASTDWDTLKLQEHLPCMHRRWVQHICSRCDIIWALRTAAEQISVEAIQDRNDGYMRCLFTVLNHVCIWNWKHLRYDSLSSSPNWRGAFSISSNLSSRMGWAGSSGLWTDSASKGLILTAVVWHSKGIN